MSNDDVALLAKAFGHAHKLSIELSDPPKPDELDVLCVLVEGSATAFTRRLTFSLRGAGGAAGTHDSTSPSSPWRSIAVATVDLILEIARSSALSPGSFSLRVVMRAPSL